MVNIVKPSQDEEVDNMVELYYLLRKKELIIVEPDSYWLPIAFLLSGLKLINSKASILYPAIRNSNSEWVLTN